MFSLPSLLSVVSATALAWLPIWSQAAGRTWFVAPAISGRSDQAGDGSESRPLRGLRDAASRLEAGDTLVLLPGEYRETLNLAGLHATAAAPTVIRAAVPATAVIKGSDVVQAWRQRPDGVWEVDWTDRPQPQQVHVDGRPLQQVGGTVFGGYPENPLHELARAHVNEGGIWLGRIQPKARLPKGSFWLDDATKRLQMLPPDGTGPNALVEVSARPYVFVAENMRHLHVRDLVFEHANTSLHFRQGAVKVFGSGNVLSGIRIQRMDAIGLQLFGEDSRLERSTISDCGQMGLNARGRRLVIEGNAVLRNNSRRFNKWWEAGGMKMIGGEGFHDSIIRRNLVAFNLGDGIWVDWKNRNNLIDENVVAYNEGFGIHYEASQSGTIQGNWTYGNSLRGIYLLESRDSSVLGNVSLGNALEGIVVADGERSRRDAQLLPVGNRVEGNLIGWNRGDAQLMLPSRDLPNTSNANILVAQRAPRLIAGWASLLNRPMGLTEWTRQTGQDAKSREWVEPLPQALGTALRDQRPVKPEMLPPELRRPLPATPKLD